VNYRQFEEGIRLVARLVGNVAFWTSPDVNPRVAWEPRVASWRSAELSEEKKKHRERDAARESCFWIFLDLCPSIPHCVPFCTPTCISRETESILEGKRERSGVSVVCGRAHGQRRERIWEFTLLYPANTRGYRDICPIFARCSLSAPIHTTDNVLGPAVFAPALAVAFSAEWPMHLPLSLYPIEGIKGRHPYARTKTGDDQRRARSAKFSAKCAVRGANTGLLRSSVKRDKINDVTSNE